MSLSILTYDEVGLDAWRSFVGECDEAWVGHAPENLTRLGSNARAFAVADQGQIVAVFVGGIIKWQKIIVLSGPGPAILPNSRRGLVLSVVRRQIENIAEADGVSAMWVKLETLAPAWARQNYWTSTLTDIGCKCGWPAGDSVRSQIGQHYVVDLSKSEDEIVLGFSSGHRRALNRAIKAGISVVSCEPAGEDWASFRSIIKEMLLNNGLADYSEDYYRYIKALCHAGYGKIYLGFKGGKAVSALSIQSYKGRASFLAGGGTSEAYQYGAFVMLHFGAMQDLARSNHNYYDLGVMYPGLAGTKMGNIGIFKSRFGGEKWPEISGERIFDERRYFHDALLEQVWRKWLSYRFEDLANVARWLGLRRKR